MPQVLGMTSSASNEAWWSENARRRVFYLFPQGAAPLLGLLSMMDSEATGHPEFGWWEERMDPFASKTAAANAAGPFANTSGADLTAGGWSQSAGDSIRIYVDDYTQFRERDIIWVRNVLNTSDAQIQIKGRVSAIASGYITVQLTSAVSNARNSAANLDLDVIAIGTSTAEGDRSRSGGMKRPIEITNYCQIMRTGFNLTGNALQIGTRYDGTGDYKKAAKDNGLRHSVLLERAFWFGERGKTTRTTDDGDTTPERRMGGFEWFLRQWELGDTGNGGAFDYRPDGADITASDWRTEDDKRIIDVDGDGTLTKAEFNRLQEMLFSRTGDEAFEKIGFCGNGFVSAFSEFVANGSVVKRELFSNGKAGFSFHEWEGPHGTIFLKTHPLFNQLPAFKNSCYFIDLGYLKYRHVVKRDTDIRKNIQPNDADYRRDEYFSDCGLELRFPEAHMLVNNVQRILR